MPNKISEIRRGNRPSPQALSRKRVVIWVIFIFSIFNIFKLIPLQSLSDLTTPVEPIGMERMQMKEADPNMVADLSKTAVAKSSRWVSYPKNGATKNIQPTNMGNASLCELWKRTTKYAPRMFLGGGKAGSTGLWQMLLTGTSWFGAGPNSSDFIGFAQKFKNREHTRNTGKEMCFGSRRYPKTVEHWESLFEPSSNVSRIGLDCCPQGTEKDRVCALWKLFPCEVKFLMPVRDPGDRSVSWFNDKLSSHQKNSANADAWTVKHVSNRNYQLFDILKDALECGVDPKAILVVDTDGLKSSEEEAQLVMNAIDEHYGLPRMRHKLVIKNKAAAASSKEKPAASNGRHMNAKTKPETKDVIRKKLARQTRGFLGLLENPGDILKRSLNFSSSAPWP